MNKLEESWLTFTEVVLPILSLGSYAVVAFVLMTAHAEGRLSFSQSSVGSTSAASVLSPYGAPGRSWSSVTTEGCIEYTHPAPKDWSDYA